MHYKPNADLTVYLTYAKGFQAGGYAPLNPFAAALKPQEVEDVEGGIKGRLFGRLLTFDISAYYYNYTNLIVTQLNQAGTALASLNAGKARLYGLEANFDARPVDGLHFNLALGLSKARYVTFSQPNTDLFAPSASYVAANDPYVGKLLPGCPAVDANGAPLALAPNVSNNPGSVGAICPVNLKGNALNRAPDYTVNAGADYSIESAIGKFTLRGEASISGKMFFTAFNTPAFTQKAYSVLNASLAYEHSSGRYYARLWARNLTNKYYFVGQAPSSNAQGGQAYALPGTPRTIGITAGFNL